MSDHIPVPQPPLTPEQIAVGKDVEIRRLTARVLELEQRQSWIDTVGPPAHPDDERQWVLAYLSAQERVAALTQALQQAVTERDRLESVLRGEALVQSIHYEPGRPLDLRLSHPLVAAIAASIADLLDQAKAENYLELSMASPTERFTLTMQRASKPTPHELRRQAERQLQQAVEALAGLIRESSDVANEALVSAQAALATHKEKG